MGSAPKRVQNTTKHTIGLRYTITRSAEMSPRVEPRLYRWWGNVVLLLCFPSDNVQRMSIANNGEETKRRRRVKERHSKPILTHKRPPKPEPPCISSVKLRLINYLVDRFWRRWHTGGRYALRKPMMQQTCHDVKPFPPARYFLPSTTGL